MALGQSRPDLQAAAQAKLDDAAILLRHGSSSNAYYLAGYAVELGLKACIAARVAAETIPDKAFIKGILSHQFTGLVALAGLAQALRDAQAIDPDLQLNWAIVLEWEPDSRYESRDATSARVLLSAISDPTSGVLPWIKAHW